MQRQQVHRFLRSALALALSTSILMSSTPAVFAQESDGEYEETTVSEVTPVTDVSPSPSTEPTPKVTVPPDTEQEQHEPTSSTEQVSVVSLQVEDRYIEVDPSATDYQYHPVFTVTFSDGHTTEPTTESVEYQGRRYYLKVQDGQVFGNPWPVGDYTATATLIGVDGISDTFTVHVVESLIQSLNVQNVEILEGTDGSVAGAQWETENGIESVRYYFYEYSPLFFVTMVDGTVLQGSDGRVEFQGEYYYVEYEDDQAWDTPWNVGTHTVIARLNGVEDEFEVNIREFPAQSVQVQEVTLVKDLDANIGYEDVDGESIPYPIYDFNPNLTITMEDGSKLVSSGSEITYEGECYYPTVVSEQGYNNQWGLGTHQAEVWILGQRVTVPVNIVETIVQDVQFEEISILEGNSCWEESTPEGTYYKYEYRPQGVVTLFDGTEIECNGNWIEYNGKWYSMEFQDDQSYSNPWGPGEHEVEFSVAGYHGTFTVTIVETYIQSIQMEDVVLEKYSSGGFVEEGENKYWRYTLHDATATITMQDGSIENLNWNNGGLYYEGRWYPLEVQDGQSAATPWDVGKHQVTATLMGYTFTFNVTVEEGMAETLEVEDVTLILNSSGSWQEEWIGSDQVTYWLYHYEPDFKVTLKDGTELTNNGTGVYYENQWYPLLMLDDQSGQAPWGLGTHQAYATLMGQMATFQVTIVESPVESIDAPPVRVLENTCGYLTYSYDENGEQVEWYCYDESQLAGDLTIHMKDGTQLVTEYNRVEYQGETYEVQYSSNQSYENQWQVGGTYEMEASVLGVTTTVQVTVMEKEDVPYTYMVQNGGIYINGYEGTEETLVIPDTICGMPVVAVFGLGSGDTVVKNLTVPDSVKTVSMEFSREAVLETLSLGAGLDRFSILSNADDFPLRAIYVSEENPYYTSVDGVLYDHDVKTLLYYPLARGYDYQVPDSVEDIELIFRYPDYAMVNPVFTENSVGYVQVDGVLYDKEMTTVYRCDRSKSGDYDMPDSVTEIAYSAFANCNQLTSVKVSNKVTCIVYSAFANCSALETVSMPESVTEISGYAFAACTSLEQLDLPGQLKQIGEAAFRNSVLISIKIPDSVTRIGSVAFESTPLTWVDLGDRVESMGYKAFASTLISEVSIPDSVMYVDSYIFSECNKLERVNFGTGLNAISFGAFQKCTALDNVTLPENIIALDDRAFAQCSNLETLEILGEEVYLGERVFEDCSLANYTPGTNIVAMGRWAFVGTQIRSAVISKNVTSIVYGVFENCTNLEQIAVPKEVLSFNGHAMDNTKWYNDQKDGAVYLQHILYDYKGDMPANTALEIRSGTLALADYALEDAQNLTQVTMPQGLRYIGTYAFHNALNLKRVDIPLGVTEIGQSAFQACVNLREVVIPRTVTEIGSSAFWGCSGLTIYGEEGSYVQEYAQDNGINFVPIPVMKDPASDSGIQVTVPEDTFTQEVTLVTNVVKDEAEQPEITYPNTVIVKDALIVDISFRDQNGEEVQPNGEVTVAIPVPENMDGEKCTVYHVGDDGTVEEMNAVYLDGYMVFATNHFSYYVLAQVELVGVAVSGTIVGNLTDVTVALYNQDGLLVGSVTGGGSYALEGVLAGTYTLKVSKDNYVTREYSITVEDKTVIQNVKICPLGDMNGDGILSVMDLNRLYAHISGSNPITDDYVLACADTVQNGSISVADLNWMYIRVSGSVSA